MMIDTIMSVTRVGKVILVIPHVFPNLHKRNSPEEVTVNFHLVAKFLKGICIPMHTYTHSGVLKVHNVEITHGSNSLAECGTSLLRDSLSCMTTSATIAQGVIFLVS